MNVNLKIALWSFLYAVIYIFLNIIYIRFVGMPRLTHLILLEIVVPLISFIFVSITIATLKISTVQKVVWIFIVLILSAFLGTASFLVIAAIWGTI